MATATEEHVVQERMKESEHELHPLQDTWTYYLFIYKGNDKWDESIIKVATFGTIEHFWSVMYNTAPPSRTPNGTDIFMFRSDIEPKWEHPRNENGGRWLVPLTPDSPIDR
ncbi:hypothetical protein FBUS_09564 [Fasciolopsis buskii]|uniref:Eukaryotic translation initiation factor 4E n=1 Tax=Fasciolopsis buskii TaxID=27845 RepID=A0A8E0VI84_9TREM|nr:hypothetical protein FBUS_09564 [Fasciolopsis buski]